MSSTPCNFSSAHAESSPSSESSSRTKVSRLDVVMKLCIGSILAVMVTLL